MTFDSVLRPRHYNSHPCGYEPKEIVRHLPFNRGSAVQYVWRAGMKGPALEDWQKAAWYVRDEIQNFDVRRRPRGGPMFRRVLSRYVETEPDQSKRIVVRLLADAITVGELETALHYIEKEIGRLAA